MQLLARLGIGAAAGGELCFRRVASAVQLLGDCWMVLEAGSRGDVEVPGAGCFLATGAFVGEVCYVEVAEC